MKRERGSALILAIFVIALVTAIGISLLFVAGSDVKMNQASLRARRAFYLSEAGIETGREALRVNNLASANITDFDDELLIAAGPNGVLDTNPANLQGVYDAQGKATAAAGFGDDVPLRGFTAFGNGGYGAFLTNDAVDGANNLNDTNGRLVVTSVGAGSSRSVEVTEAILEQMRIPSPPGMISMLGSVAPGGFQGGNSAAKDYIGDDCSGCTGFTGDPAAHLPTVATVDATSATNAQGGVGGGSFQTGSTTGAATVQDVASTVDPLWLDCAYLRDLAYKVKAAAGFKCEPTGSCVPPWASLTLSSITFLDRDATLQDGKGLLWVTGELQSTGNASWRGTILVIGEGTFLRDGGGSGETWGAVVIADIAGPNGVFGDGDDCTGPNAGFGNSEYLFSGAGNHEHVFCGDAIRRSEAAFPINVVGFRQH